MIACTTAVVLAAGLGRRMRRDADGTALDLAQAAAAAAGMKAMIPDSRGRPFLDHVLSSLADGGVRDVCLAIGPDHDAIREHYQRRPPRRVEVSFVVQPAPRGTADAMLTARAWIGDRDILLIVVTLFGSTDSREQHRTGTHRRLRRADVAARRYAHRYRRETG